MIGVTLESPGYEELAEEAKARFMRHTGLNCVKVSTREGNNYSVKLQLWKMFLHTKQSFVFFDCDCWAVRDVDLSEFDNHNDFFAVTDSLNQRIGPHNWPESFTRLDALRYGIPFEKMINGGFWIANAKNHREIFERALSNLRDESFHFSDFGEQSSLSHSIHRDPKVKLSHLPVHYNAMIGGSTPLSEICDNPFFVHAAGVPIEKKLDLLRNPR